MGDVVYDAYQGIEKFKEKLPLRNLAVLYPNVMQIVAPQGGIKKVSDMKGKTISTGARKWRRNHGLRILEANGINPDKDIKRDRLGASESAGALRMEIGWLFLVRGVPTAAVLISRLLRV